MESQNKNKKPLPAFLRLTTGRTAHIAFTKYCISVSNQALIADAKKKIDRLKLNYAISLTIGASFIYWILGLTPSTLLIWALSGELGKQIGGAIGIVVYPILIGAGYGALLNWQVPKLLIKPDASNFVHSDEALDIKSAPDPNPETGFVIGTTGDKDMPFMRWNWDCVDYNTNLLVIGQSHNYGQGLLSELIWGSLGFDPNTIFLILNSRGGLNFAWLRKNYEQIQVLVRMKNFDTLSDDSILAELAQIDKFPNIIIKDEDTIQNSLMWLSSEYRKRVRLSNIPDTKFNTRIITVLDWELTEEFRKPTNVRGDRAILWDVLQTGRQYKMHLIAVANPIIKWRQINENAKEFLSTLEFFHTDFIEKEEKGEKKEIGIRNASIPARQFSCRLWWRGPAKNISILNVGKDEDLAAFAYAQVSKASQETSDLWKNGLYYSVPTNGSVKRSYARIPDAAEERELEPTES